MKVALVHDYLGSFGGAERVLYSLHEIFPEAPIYTLYSEVEKSPLLKEKFKDAKIIESWFGKLPFSHRLISPLRFLLPAVWSSFNFSKFDLVISSASWAVTKGFAQGKVKEICYCHTPPRYLYGYETSRDWKKHWYIRIYALIVNHFMRMYDFYRAQKVTWFIANSREVQQRIQKFYRRDSVVINPPVDIPEFIIQNSKLKIQNYYLTGGRMEMPKNFDPIVKACNLLKVPLKIYGDGLQRESLEEMAGSTIEFVGTVSDEEKNQLFKNAKAFIVAAVYEDFGITPVEAMAFGTPVIAYRGGGYLETVVEGKTGVFFNEATVTGVVEGIEKFEKIKGKIKAENCRKQAEKFSKERFKKEIKKFVEEHA